MDTVQRNPLSTITNTVSTKFSKSLTQPVAKKLVETDEQRRLRIAKEGLEPHAFKFHVLGNYKGQVWLVKTDPQKLKLKVSTLSDHPSVCATYKKVNDVSWLGKPRTKTKDRNPETFDCHLCKKKLTNSTNLNKHLRVTHLAPKLLCPHCNFSSYSPHRLYKHVEKHNKEIQCPKCKKPFKTLPHRKRHLLTCKVKC